MHPAEGQVTRLPHLHTIGIGCKDWTADVVRADQEHRDRHAVEPAIFLRQRPRTRRIVAVVLRRAFAIKVVDYMDRLTLAFQPDICARFGLPHRCRRTG